MICPLSIRMNILILLPLLADELIGHTSSSSSIAGPSVHGLISLLVIVAIAVVVIWAIIALIKWSGVAIPQPVYIVLGAFIAIGLILLIARAFNFIGG
jgi:hypothetical protein